MTIYYKHKKSDLVQTPLPILTNSRSLAIHKNIFSYFSEQKAAAV